MFTITYEAIGWIIYSIWMIFWGYNAFFTRTSGNYDFASPLVVLISWIMLIMGTLIFGGIFWW